jgi:hypothetical protein
MNWIGAKGRFRVRRDLIYALSQNYGGWKLVGILLGIIWYSYPVLLLYLGSFWRFQVARLYHGMEGH